MEKINIPDTIEIIKKTASPLKRQLLTVALITRLFEEEGKTPPILIGGCALSYYSREVYFTADIDLACEDKKTLDDVLKRIGFVKAGRYWISERLDAMIESPASRLAGEDAQIEVVEIEDGLSCSIIGLEDLIIDRMNACKHWGSETDCEMSELLVHRYINDIDWDYLLKKAGEPDNNVLSELSALRRKASE